MLRKFLGKEEGRACWKIFLVDRCTSQSSSSTNNIKRYLRHTISRGRAILYFEPCPFSFNPSGYYLPSRGIKNSTVLGKSIYVKLKDNHLSDSNRWCYQRAIVSTFVIRPYPFYPFCEEDSTLKNRFIDFVDVLAQIIVLTNNTLWENTKQGFECFTYIMILLFYY